MKKLKLILLTCILVPNITMGAADKTLTLKSEPGASKVIFLAVGRPSMLKIHGTASSGPAAEFKLEASQLKGTVDFEMEKLDTGIDLRTRHMKEKYLHVKDHPKAKLTLLEAPVDEGFASTLTNAGEKTFKGKMQLHGKEEEVSGTFTAKEGLVHAKFPIKLSQFAIDIPSYLGVTVADMVDVTVELPLKKQ